MAKLRGGDRRLAFIGADFVDDLQYALAIGAELHAEFRHDAAVVDHEVARSLPAGTVNLVDLGHLRGQIGVSSRMG